MFKRKTLESAQENGLGTQELRDRACPGKGSGSWGGEGGWLQWEVAGGPTSRLLSPLPKDPKGRGSRDLRVLDVET